MTAGIIGGGIAGIGMNFKTLLYDLYSKDLSEKVRAALAVRKEQGQYVSAVSPFGYEKPAGDRHGLVIAEEEAAVVRKIFSLALDGWSLPDIAGFLNETGIKTPVEFKIEKGETDRKPKRDKFYWCSSTIWRILKNEVYIGNIVQKKYKKDFPGGKNHLNPQEKWLITSGHHPPIIEEQAFYEVQKRYKK